MKALIVGAGIGGLTAALALHAIGVEVVVVERAEEIRPVGVGVNVQPEAIRELTALGLDDQLARVAIATSELVFFDHRGTRKHAEPRGRAAGYAWPQYSIRRGDLQLLLLETVRTRIGPDAVRTGVSFASATTSASGTSVALREAGTAGSSTIEVDLLVGADGIHSAVCQWLYPEGSGLRWSGTWMWRGVLETEPILSTDSMIHVNDGTSTRMVAYPIAKDAANRGRSLTNWVCQVSLAAPRPMAADETWTTTGLAEDITPHYADWSTDIVDILALIRRTERIISLPMVDREPLPEWGRHGTTLLGDAAHPMYPVGANGATQAIVDAAALARHLAGRCDLAAALRGYEAERRAATSAIVMANREMDEAERSAPDMHGIDYRYLMSRYRQDTNAEPAAVNTRIPAQ